MAVFNSNTSILAINFGDFGCIATDSRCTNRWGVVGSNRENKTARLYPGVWVAVSGSELGCDLILTDLPLMMADVYPNPSSMGEIADLVADFMNDGLTRNMEVTLILIGSIGGDRFRSYKIQRLVDEFYYPSVEPFYSTAGSGSFVLNAFPFRREFNRNMSYSEAADYASQAIWTATQKDWRSGGEIRVVLLLPQQRDALMIWTQDNPFRCADPYFIRKGPLFYI